MRYVFFLILLIPVLILGQDYISSPECVSYDAERDLYYVSCFYSGRIVTIDSTSTQAIFKEGLGHAYANEIVGDTLFVTTGQGVTGIDRNTAETIYQRDFPNVQQIDGFIYHEGSLYILEYQHRIIRLHLASDTAWNFVPNGIPGAPQDIIYDALNDAFLIGTYADEAPLVQVNLADSSVHYLVTTPMGNFDGIAMDEDRNIYLSSWETHSLHMYNADLINPPLLVADNLPGPANICYNAVDRVIAVPCFNGSRVELVPLPDHYLAPHLTVSPVSGNAPLTVNCTDQSYAAPAIDEWSWDFDGDGVEDASGEAPSFEYLSPGTYSISCTVTNADTSLTMVLEDTVRVFNGETSLFFTNDETGATVAADSSLNLRENLTLEAWINPDDYGQSPIMGGTILDKTNFVVFITLMGGLFNSHSVVVLSRYDDGTVAFSATPIFTIWPEGWTHIAVTYAAAESDLRIYINGVSRTLEHTNPPSGLLADHGDWDLNIGVRGGINHFRGCIDEFRLWERCLEPAEIQANMDSPEPANSDSLVLWFDMNEAGGDSLFDRSGNGFRAILTQPRWREGTLFYPTSVEKNGAMAPTGPHLVQCYPNPFNAEIALQFEVKEAGRLSVEIYDIRGEMVRNLASRQVSAGRTTLHWNGRDDRNQIVATGTYLARVVTASDMTVRKLCLLR